MGSYIDGRETKEILMEKQLDEMKKNNKLVAKKDYIAYALAVISIIITIIFGFQKQGLVKNKQKINQITQIIQQNNSYNQLPLEIKTQIENIATVSGDTVKFIGNK